jgi:hypothetical protein
VALTPEERRERQRERQRRWREANAEKERERKRVAARLKYAANPEEGRERRRRWRAENLDRAREVSRRWYAANPEKGREHQRRWAAANPDHQRQWRAANPAYDRDYMRRWRHGNMEQLDGIQEKSCYLCGDPLPDDRARWRVDHDHRCCPPGKSCQYCRRGLACHQCNVLIGLALDDPERLRRIAGNLEAALADVTRRLAHKPAQGELFDLYESGEASSHS